MVDEARIARLERVLYQLATTMYGEDVAQGILGLAAPPLPLMRAGGGGPRARVARGTIQYTGIGAIPRNIRGDLSRVVQPEGVGPHELDPPMYEFEYRDVANIGAAAVTLVLIPGGIRGSAQMPASQAREAFLPPGITQTLESVIANARGRVVVWIVHPSQASQRWDIRDLVTYFQTVRFGQVRLLNGYESPERILNYGGPDAQPNLSTVSKTLWAALEEAHS